MRTTAWKAHTTSNTWSLLEHSLNQLMVFPLWKMTRWLERHAYRAALILASLISTNCIRLRKWLKRYHCGFHDMAPGSHGNLSKSNWWPSKWQGNHPGLSGPLNLTPITDKRRWGVSPHILHQYSKGSCQNRESCSSSLAKHLLPIKYIPWTADETTANQLSCFDTFLNMS